MAYKSFVYAIYLSDFLTELETNRPKTFVTFQSLFYILGELLTLIVLFVIDLIGITKKSQRGVRSAERRNSKQEGSAERKSSDHSDRDEMKKSMVNHSEEDDDYDNTPKSPDQFRDTQS